MRFVCCGVVYSTQDPDTYQYIDTFLMKSPTLNIIGGKKVEKELLYVLCCKKNGCIKAEIHRYYKKDDVLKILETRMLKGASVIKFLEETKDMRIRLPQYTPIKKIYSAKKIPWVYGKTIDSDTQVARYIDESGDRCVFKNNAWEKEVFKSNIDRHFN